jgi:hypothetical protein
MLLIRSRNNEDKHQEWKYDAKKKTIVSVSTGKAVTFVGEKVRLENNDGRTGQ